MARHKAWLSWLTVSGLSMCLLGSDSGLALREELRTVTVSSAQPVAAIETPSCPAASAPRFYTSGHTRRIALTFDDGPGPGTAGVLDTLKAEGEHATFFVLGKQAKRRPAAIRRIAREGHALGNHSYDHTDMTTLGPGGQRREIEKTGTIVAGITGRPLCLFRPPYGSHNRITDSVARRLQLQTVLWSVDTEDWRGRSTGPARDHRELARAVAGDRMAHPILLLHDGDMTSSVLRTVIRHYRARGYEFTRVDGSSF